MRMKRILLPALMLCALAACSQPDSNARRSIAFWNVENYFDTRHDTMKADHAFTPQGENRWTAQRYARKRDNIYKMIAAMKWPIVVGLAEVENDRVLEDLCMFTPLRNFGYKYVHYESPDERGVDCALMYRQELFGVVETSRIVVSDSAEDFYTRDILMVGGVMIDCGDTCYLLINHWPSKLGGPTADKHRLDIAHRLRLTMDSLMRQHPTALVMAMGDFNASPDEEAVSRGMGFGGKERNDEGIYNLMVKMKKGEGSYKYKDIWSNIDQFFANRWLEVEVFAPDFALKDDEHYLGKKPFRTYVGMKYQGGYSDHLPIIAILR